MAGRCFGKYELDRELGRGPLGKVYAAKNVETGQMVVFRGFQRPQNADDAHWNQAIQRFHSELTAAQKLNHPHIAKVYESGLMGSLYYVVTEYFEGKTVRQIVDQEGKQDVERVVDILKQVCEVIQYATEQGMNHGDLTPYNIIVLDDGNIKVINYGLAHTRNRLGSPYLSPEQLTGAPGDDRSDLFALGAIAYELLTGAAAFRADTVEQLCRNIIGAHPPALLGVPPYLQGIVWKMLAKNPDERYESASRALNDLREQFLPREFMDEVVAPKPVAAHTPWERNHYQPPPSLAEYKLDESDLAEVRERIRVRRWKMIKLGERISLRVVAVVVVIFLASTVMDALTASRKEVALTVVATTGAPRVRPAKLAEMNAWIPVKKDDLINAGDILRTNKASTITLRMQDGTRVKMSGGSELMVKEFTYRRKKAAKIREFELHDGRVWARVRGMRGKKNVFSIASAGGKIKVTGTDIGAISEDGKQATFVTFEGSSKVETPQGTTTLDAGKQVEVDVGKIISEVQAIAKGELALFDAQTDLQESDPLLVSIRQSLVHAEEGLLMPVLGAVANLGDLKPKDFNKNYFQQIGGIAKAMTAMRAITIALEGDPEYPETIGLTDLSGLGLDAEGVKKILEQFDGNKLLSYQRVAPDGYEFTARANTGKKELLRARRGTVEVVDEGNGGGGEDDDGGQGNGNDNSS